MRASARDNFASVLPVGIVRTGLVAVTLTAGCMLLAGCPQSSELTVNSTPPPNTAPAPSSASPATRSAIPIPEANIQEAVARLPGLVKTVMDATGIPGVAVAVVHGGKTVYAQGFGVRKVGESAPVTADTVFQIASLSKSVSGTVVAKVVGEHTDTVNNYPVCHDVCWDTPVHDYLPDFSLSDPWVTEHVTVGDLLSHRSGLPDHAGDGLEVLGFDRQQILSRLSQLPLNPFRISYGYTNFGLTAGALAVADAEGLDWASLAEQELFAPLGMNSTSYRYSDFLSQSNRTALHVKQDGRWQALYTMDDDIAAPAGGVSSSVTDMAQWMKLILADGKFDDRQLIAPSALLSALSPQVVASPPDAPATRAGFYGHGFNISYGMSGRVKLTHSGSFPAGAGTTYEMIPSADVGIVVLTNATAIGAAETIAGQFSDIVQYGKILTNWPALYKRLFSSVDAPSGDLAGEQPPANPVPPKPDDAYIGTYHSDYFGDATVAVKDGQLTLTLGPTPLEYDLLPWNGDEFAIDMIGRDFPPGSMSSVWFKVNGDGAASQMTVTVFNNSFAASANPDDAFSPYFRVSGP